MGSASGAHPELGLGGPGIWLMVGAIALVGLAAAVVLADVALRPDRFRGTAHRVLWALPQVACLVALTLGFALGGRYETVTAVGLALPVALVAQIAYLLRVVFPKRPAGVPADVSADRDAGADDR